MKSRLIGITLSFAAVIIIITVCFSVSNQSSNPQDIQAEQIIAANEIEQLTQMGRVEESAKKAAQLQQAIRKEVKKDSRNELFFE